MDSREETDRPPVIGEVESLEEELTLLSTGRALSITVSAASRHFSRPGIAFRRIVDIPGSTLSVAWRADAETPIVRRFVEIAVAVRDRETALVDWVSAGGG